MQLRQLLRVGHSFAITLPPDYVQRLGVARGDLLEVSFSKDGYILITKPFPPSRQKAARDAPPFHP